MNDQIDFRPRGAQAGSSVLRRFGEIINLFTEDRSTLDLGEIKTCLQTSEATAYRYVSALIETGLISRFGGRYIIGPKVRELDYLMQHYDPILSLASARMEALNRENGSHVLLSRIFGMTITNVHHIPGIGIDALNFIPGRKMPLFRGSQARVILASLERRKLKKIYDLHSDDPGRDRIGKGWKGFSKALLKNRQDGYYISYEELDVGIHGIAAPIFDAFGDVTGALVCAYAPNLQPELAEAELVGRVVEEAATITASVMNSASQL